MKKREINPGTKINRLTIIEETAPIVISNKPRRMVKCKCDCGNICKVQLQCLFDGHTKSCGCLQKEVVTKYSKKHGLSDKHPLYQVWKNMKKRCLNPNATEYRNYGGRGICVCDTWAKDFKAFYDWAIDHGWTEDLTIDRIDVNGNYCAENCRWVDFKSQMNNMTRNHYVMFDEKTFTLSTLSEYLNIPYNIVRYRISRCKWNVKQLINYWNDRN